MELDPTKYYFTIEKYTSKIIFNFTFISKDKDNKKIDSALILVHDWISENITDDFKVNKYEDRKEIMLSYADYDCFLKKEKNFEDWLQGVYIYQLNNPMEVFRKANLLKLKNEAKNLKTIYIVHISKEKKEWAQASELLVDFILKNNKIYTTKVDTESEVWIYKEGIYLPQGRSEIKEILRNILEEHYNSNIYNLVIAKIEASTFVDFEKFFNTCYKELIPVENGILNVLTGELKDFDPEFVFFNKLPVKYDSKAECKIIDKFLSDILSNEDDKKVFYEYVGFCLYKEYTFEMALMLVGDGRNGKTKCVELIKRFLGVANCSGISLYNLSKGGSIVAKLFGKMANIASDLEASDLKDTGLIKGLTGQSLQTADRKYLNAIEFINYAKMIFATNNLPLVYDTSKGFWSRWILLEFPYTFVKQEEYDLALDKSKLKIRDPEIIDKISTPEEMSGLLNKAILGLQDCFKNKGFSFTKGSDEVKTKWIRQSNSFAAFCNDFLEENYDSYVLKRDIRKKYSDYCKQHNLKSKSDKVIKTTLETEFGAVEERKSILDAQEHVWVGIKFKQEKILPPYPSFSKESRSSPTFLYFPEKAGYPDYFNKNNIPLIKIMLHYMSNNKNRDYTLKDFDFICNSENNVLECFNVLVERGDVMLIKENTWRVVI